MPRLNGNNSNYFNLTGGLSYRTFKDHFERMSLGEEPNLLIRRRSVSGKQKQPFRYVKIATESHPEDMPKVEVVDPNEAIKKMASSQLKRQVADNDVQQPGPPQSASGRRKRSTTSKASVATTSAKIIRRAKDVFDK